MKAESTASVQVDKRATRPAQRRAADLGGLGLGFKGLGFRI